MIYYANEQSPYIQHYGVLGMRWGHRRSNGQSTNRRIQKKHLEKNKPVDSFESYKVFSKSLGRYLTEEELINKGLL